jgi:hypothetical protein
VVEQSNVLAYNRGMSRHTIVSNPARVFAFVSEHLPMQMVAGMQGLGLERDGELVAGVLYEGVNAQNAWMHVAAPTGG